MSTDCAYRGSDRGRRRRESIRRRSHTSTSRPTSSLSNACILHRAAKGGIPRTFPRAHRCQQTVLRARHVSVEHARQDPASHLSRSWQVDGHCGMRVEMCSVLSCFRLAPTPPRSHAHRATARERECVCVGERKRRKTIHPLKALSTSLLASASPLPNSPVLHGSRTS